MTPTVRGTRRLLVGAVLLASAAATGALAGFAAGVAWTLLRLPAVTRTALVVLVVAALAADVAHRRSGRLTPWAVRRQVPQVWSRLFGAGTVALLYGARLGVGPLTILSTWLWWAAAIAAASLGPASSTAAGALFGAGRVAVMLAVAEWLRAEAPARMARLRAAEAAAATALVPAVVAVAILA